jgi:hypothetical protein
MTTEGESMSADDNMSEEYKNFLESLRLAREMAKDGTQFPVYDVNVTVDGRYCVARFDSPESPAEFRNGTGDWPKELIRVLAKLFD